jgi:hypothetical protein
MGWCAANRRAGDCAACNVPRPQSVSLLRHNTLQRKRAMLAATTCPCRHAQSYQQYGHRGTHDAT